MSIRYNGGNSTSISSLPLCLPFQMHASYLIYPVDCIVHIILAINQSLTTTCIAIVYRRTDKELAGRIAECMLLRDLCGLPFPHLFEESDGSWVFRAEKRGQVELILDDIRSSIVSSREACSISFGGGGGHEERKEGYGGNVHRVFSCPEAIALSFCSFVHRH